MSAFAEELDASNIFSEFWYFWLVIFSNSSVQPGGNAALSVGSMVNPGGINGVMEELLRCALTVPLEMLAAKLQHRMASFY